MRMLKYLVLWVALVAPLTIHASNASKTETAVLEGGFAKATAILDNRHTVNLSRSVALWDSWEGDVKRTGRLTYGPFVAGNSIELMIAGFPGSPGETLSLSSVDTGEHLILRPRAFPNDRWVRYRWSIPDGWAGRRVLLVAEDNAKDDAGWLGVSSPLQHSTEIGTALLESLLQLSVFLLLLLPGVAILLMAPKVRQGHMLPLLLVGSATTSYAMVFCYLAHPLAGRTASWTILICCLGVLTLRWRVLMGLCRQIEFILPLVLSAAVALLYFTGGFLFGGIESPEGVPMSRILQLMPPDSLLPHWFAGILAKGEPLRPFFADWLTSDRPPLQTGFNLLLWPFVPNRLGYEAIGIAAQCWVWIGLWSMLRNLRVSMRSTAVIFSGAIFSGFFFFNSFFCWPKLLPAAFLLLAAGLLFKGDKEKTPDVATTLLATACLAFAYLGHGASVFGILGIALAYLLQGRRLKWRFVAIGAVTFGLFIAPWVLYQKVFDPPGDRLIKYHIAGREEIDPRGSLTVIREAYAAKTWQEILSDRGANVRMLFYKHGHVVENFSALVTAITNGKSTRLPYIKFHYGLREAGFFHYFQTLGPMLIGFTGFVYAAIRHKKNLDWHIAKTIALISVLTTAVWCALLFTREMTVIHTSSYFFGACLYICAGIGLQYWPNPVVYVTLFLNFAWFYLLWVFGPLSTEEGALLPSPFEGFIWLMAAISTLLAWLLFCIARLKDASCVDPQPQLKAVE